MPCRTIPYHVLQLILHATQKNPFPRPHLSSFSPSSSFHFPFSFFLSPYLPLSLLSKEKSAHENVSSLSKSPPNHAQNGSASPPPPPPSSDHNSVSSPPRNRSTTRKTRSHNHELTQFTTSGTKSLRQSRISAGKRPIFSVCQARTRWAWKSMIATYEEERKKAGQ